MEINRNL